MLTPAQPRPGGGRNLHAIDLLHVAVTPSPMNPETRVLSVKTAAGNVSWAPVLTVAQNTAVEAHRNDPDRDRLRRMAEVVAGSWLSPALQAALSVEDAYQLVESSAAAKAVREAAPDEGTRVGRERWEKVNRQSAAMHAAMKLPPVIGGCGHCAPCKVGGARHCLYPVR
jgi:hypothetical protein